MEFGGYLPLELDIKDAFYKENENYELISLNSGRTAIWRALKDMSIKKVYIPYFYCPTVIDMIRKEYELCFYHINKDFLPELVDNFDEESAIILVNYYGIMNEQISDLFHQFENVIIDNAHSFYSQPIIKKNVYNIYSCRKFFGVADGAYLIAKQFNRNVDFDKEISYNRFVHLVKSIELGTNEAYSENLENEDYIGSRFLTMSKLTQRILASIDYEKIKMKRAFNYHVLHEQLKDIQMLKNIPPSIPAYCYPLLCDKDMREKLILNHIFIPTLWKELINPKFEGTFEYKYSKYLLCLPIDQRYSESDMILLANTVKEIYMKEKRE